MRRPHLALLPLALLALVLPAAPAAAERPNEATLYHNGQDGRYLLDGPWLFRRDPGNHSRDRATTGWTPTTVPNAYNAGDNSNESMFGGVVWYRKDFELPSSSAALRWLVRFESVNYRSRVYLNGRLIGRHTGAWLPFEHALKGALRRGTNRLIVRVDHVRRRTDFPPANFTSEGVPAGGWWNYGGLTREVYLRRVDADVDIENVLVTPRFRSATGPASVHHRVLVKNYSSQARVVRLNARIGGVSIRFPRVVVAAKRAAVVRGTGVIRNPDLWSPVKPTLYESTVTGASAPPRARGRLRFKRMQSYSVRTGLRALRVAGGRLLLNGKPMNTRGFGFHEDDPVRGFAIDNAKREQYIAWAKEAGATSLRAHYPLHPQLLEAADRVGMLIWSEVPVYSVRTEFLRLRAVRSAAIDEAVESVVANGNHPSVFVWSIANELASQPSGPHAAYFGTAAKRIKALDPTRPVGAAIHAYPLAGCQREYARLDLLGVNEYFGWYAGPGGQVADVNGLGPFLDTFRACYPRKAIMVSEFGAEANRSGPADEKGTYEFQREFVANHLSQIDQKPYLSGAFYWALAEFKVRPDWAGGNPRPNPPIHAKGVIDFNGNKKPAFAEIQARYSAFPQFQP